MRGLLTRYVGDRPNSCLEIEYNWVVSVLLTLKGDLEWRYRVGELFPRARDPRPWGSCCWCDWEPMGMTVVNLINYLRLEGPHNQKLISTASEEDALSPGDERREALRKRGMALLKRVQ